MIPPPFDDIPSEPLGPGRIYDVAHGYRLAAFPIEAPLPHAPEGSIAYVWLNGDRPGTWDWTDDPEALGRIIRAFRTATSRDYRPPDRRAPGGESAQLRPTIENLVQRAMDDARPGPAERAIPDLVLHLPLD